MLRRILLSNYWRLYHCNTGREHVPTLLTFLTLRLARKAVVAHSLEWVLQLCPHQPSLLLLLLDVTLAYHLENESYALLHALFTAACKSDASFSPPICHPSNQTFLVDLCKTWASSGLTVDGFVRVLMGVLRTVDSAQIWTSKAMMAFMPGTARDSMSPFMTCVCELLGALPDIEIEMSLARSEFYHFLQRMLDTASGHLISQDHHLDTDWIIIFLDYTNSLVELTNRPSMENISLATTNTLICLATHWLWRSPGGMPDEIVRVKHLLDAIKPKPTTYDILLSRITASGDLHHLKQSIQSYTSVLRSHGLLRHEASLWSCALLQIDVPSVERTLSIRSGAQALKKFRLKLIELVEEAEKRCFGRRGSSPPPPDHDMNGYSRRRKRTSSGSGKWTWDPTFECWLPPPIDGPVLKKRKTRLDNSYPTRLSCPAPRNVCKARRRLSLCSLSRASSPEYGSGYSSPEFDRPSQGMTGFATLLCRAISNRTVLHPEKGRDDKTRTCSSPDWISRPDESDDKLDLFLCE